MKPSQLKTGHGLCQPVGCHLPTRLYHYKLRFKSSPSQLLLYIIQINNNYMKNSLVFLLCRHINWRFQTLEGMFFLSSLLKSIQITMRTQTYSQSSFSNNIKTSTRCQDIRLARLLTIYKVVIFLNSTSIQPCVEVYITLKMREEEMVTNKQIVLKECVSGYPKETD